MDGASAQCVKTATLAIRQYVLITLSLRQCHPYSLCLSLVCTPNRRQSKTLILSTNDGRLKIVRNRVFDCHMSSDWRQMAIENNVLASFHPRSSIVKIVFDCRISGEVWLPASLVFASVNFVVWCLKMSCEICKLFVWK